MSHFIASDAGRGSVVVDAERGLFALTSWRGAAGGLGASKVIWVIEEEGDNLRARTETYERAPSGETRKAVIQTLEAALRSMGPEVTQGRTPEGQPSTSFIVVHEGPGYAFVAHRGEARLDVIREGQAHPVTPPDGDAKVSHLDLLPGDRLVLSSRGFPEGALAKLPEGAGGTVEESGKALKGLLEDPQATLAVVDPPASAQAEALIARTRVLGKLFLFEGMSFDTRLRVNAICHRRTFLPGQAVVREGESGDAMYLVVSGRLKVTLSDRELTRLQPGDHFGELSLSEDMPRSATVTAVEGSDVVEISRRDLLEFARSHPDDGMQLSWRLVQYLGRRVRDLSEKVAAR